MLKSLAINLSAIAATTTLIGGLAQPALSLTFGEALGVGAGVLLIDQAIENNQQRYQYRSPEEEYRRGLEDGYNGARYDNPRDSGNYDRGYTQGRQRARAGWRSPFRK